MEELTVGKDGGASKISKIEETPGKSPSDRPTFETYIPTKGLHSAFEKFFNDVVKATTEPTLEELYEEDPSPSTGSGSETEGLSSDDDSFYY